MSFLLHKIRQTFQEIFKKLVIRYLRWGIFVSKSVSGKFHYKLSYFKFTLSLILLFINDRDISGQVPNLDSLSKTFIEREDVNKDFYKELDSFKTAIDIYSHSKPLDKILIDSKQSWAKIYASKDPIKAMDEFEESIEMAKKISYSKGIAIGKHEIGLLYFDEGLYENAIGNILQSSQMYDELHEWWVYGFSLVDIGNVYFKLKQFEIARKYYNMANNVFVSNTFSEKYEYAVSVCFNNLGLTDMEEMKYENALLNFKEGLKWRQKLKLAEYYGHSYKYIARSFLSMGIIDSALNYYKLAVEFDIKKGPKTELIRSHIGLGKLYCQLEKHKLARQQFQNAYAIAEDFEIYPALIESANELGQFYLHTNQSDSALVYFQIGFKYAKDYGQIDQRQLACEKLLEISKKNNDYPKQIEYLNELLEIERQKQNDVVLKKQLEYEVNKRISEKAISESSNKVQQLIIISAIIVLFLLFFILVNIYRSRRKYIRLNEELNNNNNKINEQKKQLEQVNQALNKYSSEIFHQKEEIIVQSESLANAYYKLKDLQNFKEGMAAMIVHDLKNPLNTILNQTKNVLVYESANQMLNMVNNILDLQKYESTVIPSNKKDEKLVQIIENALFNTRYLTEQKNIRIQNQTSRNYEVYTDAELTERIITNLLTNAIKYSSLNSLIKIVSEPDNGNYLKISIIDYGPGISDKEKSKLFEKFSQLISQNSGRTRSTGLGLAFCKMAVEAQGGKIGLAATEGGGATFWFTLILSKSSDAFEEIAQLSKHRTFEVSEENYQKLLPFIEQLKLTPIYEIAEIRKIIIEINDLGIPNINSFLSAIENAGYAVNEEEYLNILQQVHRNK